MAGFEVIVRPVVFPNIRPAPARPVAPADDPSQGIATLSGGGGGLIDLSISEQINWSRSKSVETQRRFDVARVYHTTGTPVGGTTTRSAREGEGSSEVDFDTYIDIEVLNKVWLRDGNGIMHERRYANIQPADNIAILKRDVTRKK